MKDSYKKLLQTIALMVGLFLLGCSVMFWLDGAYGRAPAAIALGASGWLLMAVLIGLLVPIANGADGATPAANMKDRQSSSFEPVPLLTGNERLERMRGWKAYGLYVAILCALLFSVMVFASGPFGEHIARNWILMMVFIIGPINHMKGPWYVLYPVGFTLLGVVLSAQGYIAYSIHHYRPDGDISNGWLLLSIVSYALAAAIAWFVASRVVWREFSIFGNP